jgi:predicted metal-dependent hydrolase
VPPSSALNLPLLTHDELPSRLGEFEVAVDQFNRRWYFESHETLEDLWQVTPLPERQFFQAIIQLAAAFVHYARREYPGILKLLDLSAEKLREFTPAQFDVDVDALLVDISDARARFEALGPERFLEFDEGSVLRIARR